MDIVKKSRLEDSSSALRWRWSDMDHNVLAQIFGKIGNRSLSLNVSWVCRSWRFACWEVLFWKRSTLDFEHLQLFSEILGGPPLAPDPAPAPAVDDDDEYLKMEMRAMKIIQSIFEGHEAYGRPLKGWSQSLKQLMWPFGFHVSDRILLYIAQRTPGLKTIYLSSSDRISRTSFTMAITHWNHLKFLIIGPIDGGFDTDIIRELGRHCNKLEYLHIHVKNFTLDEDSATAMAASLPRLKTLAFLRCSIRKSGVKVVAEQCRELNHVMIERCVLLVEEEIGPSSLTRTRLPRYRDFHEWCSEKLKFGVINYRKCC